MKLRALCFSIGLLAMSALGQTTNQQAATPAPGKSSQPIADIGNLQYVQGGLMTGRTPTSVVEYSPAMRVEFKIKDKSIDHLGLAVVYLFDKDRKLVKMLTQIDPSGMIPPLPLGTGNNPRKQTGRFPNMITALSGLKAGTAYNLIFPSPDKKDWKIAVAVIGNPDTQACVYKTSPTVVNIQELDIKEKSFAIKN